MSASPIDLYAVAKDCKATYQMLRDAVEEFTRIHDELSTMIYLLDRIASRKQQIEFDEYTKEAIDRVLSSCNKTALDLYLQLESYSVLRSPTRSTLKMYKRARWVFGSTRNAKTQVMMNIITLEFVLSQIETVYVHAKLDALIGNVEAKLGRTKSRKRRHALVNFWKSLIPSKEVLEERQISRQESNNEQRTLAVIAPTGRHFLGRMARESGSKSARRMMEEASQKADVLSKECSLDQAPFQVVRSNVHEPVTLQSRTNLRKSGGGSTTLRIAVV